MQQRETLGAYCHCKCKHATMLPWRMVVISLFYCCIKTGVTQCPRKALFPPVSRIKSGLANAASPTFQKSIDDAHLLYEILLAGIHFDASGEFSVQDAELASLYKTRNLKVICEEIIPRNLSDIYRLIAKLSNHIGHLHQDDFERTLLTLVYTAQQMFNSTNEHQRDVWEESFVSLYQAIKQDLTGL